jgi:tripartite ATP-independent transporter DctM subunit
MHMAMVVMFIGLCLFMGLNASLAISMILSVLFYILLDGRFSFTIMAERITSALDSFPYLAIPFFILSAEIMNRSKISDRIFNFASVLVGHIPGGLGQVNVLGSMIFAGMSGSAAADVAGLGALEIKAMKAEGYDPAFSAAVTAVSSTIGPIIPPSILFVVYGVMAQVSVGHLFAAGIIPGILMGVTFMITISVMASRGLVKGNLRNRPKWREAVKATISVLPSLFTPVILMGGMFIGEFTPTEAGAVCALYAFFLGFIYGDIGIRDVLDILKKGALDSAKVSFLIAAASIFGWIVTQEQIGHQAYKIIEKFGFQPWIVILLINLLLFIAGMFVEGVAMLTISVPVFLPILPAIGMDPVTFGVVLTLLVMIGFLTPPVGIGTYIAVAIAECRVEDMVKAEMPFYIPLIIVLLLISYIPALTLYIPRLLF